mgnify:CR=1 FL=1
MTKAETSIKVRHEPMRIAGKKVDVKPGNAMPMGNIISAAAVFEIHMEMKAVPSMKPSTIRRRRGPHPHRNYTEKSISPSRGRCISCQRAVAPGFAPRRASTTLFDPPTDFLDAGKVSCPRGKTFWIE